MTVCEWRSEMARRGADGVGGVPALFPPGPGVTFTSRRPAGDAGRRQFGRDRDRH